jgi:hypothetical protein
MQDTSHLAGMQEDVITTLFRDQETEAIHMGTDTSTHQVEPLGQAIAATAIPDQLAITLHGIEAALQGYAVFVLEKLQSLEEELEIERNLGFL